MAHDGSFLGHFDVPAWLSCDGSVQFDTFHHPAVDAGLEAALSSALLQGSLVVSRPSHSATAGDVGVVMGELVGQLGLVACDGGASSPYASCYSTPAGSPAAKRALPPPFAGDPGFADRAARLSCFGAGLSRVASSQSLPTEAPGAPVAAQAASCGSSGDSHGRKRKPSAKAKGTTTNVKMPDVETSAKKCKLDVDGGERDEETKPIAEHGETGQGKGKESNGKPVEPPKDYIHVRARRGQATDSHSLAERVRREKISERMKLLQDLVPGCNKVTGKAVMLDEIINYVQSLQRQVEFLSMKLATVNPRLDFNVDNFLPKDVQQPCAPMPPPAYSFEASSSPFSYASQSQGTRMDSALTNANDKDTSGLHRSLGMSHPPIDAFASANPQIESLWEDDLQSVVQMGFRGT